MEVKKDPRIVLNAQDINEIFRNLGGKSIELDDGRLVSFEIEMHHRRDQDENFANEMVEMLLKDADTQVVTEALVDAVRSSGSNWTNNEVESLVAVLNEKFGSGLDRADFMLSEEFAREDEVTELFSGTEDDMWTKEQVEDFMKDLEENDAVESIQMEEVEPPEQDDEEDESSMLENFDPEDEIKQEAALVIERNIGLSDELSLEIANELRSRGLLKEEE